MDVAVAVQDDEAIVSVRDQGVGIPAEKQARIFQRFYRAHTGTPYDYGGMGVGLYIAKEIVRAPRRQDVVRERGGQGQHLLLRTAAGVGTRQVDARPAVHSRGGGRRSCRPRAGRPNPPPQPVCTNAIGTGADARPHANRFHCQLPRTVQIVYH